MDYLNRLIRRAKLDLACVLILNNLLLVAAWYIAQQIFKLQTVEVVGAVTIFAIIEIVITANMFAAHSMSPTRAVWQTILHLAPGSNSIPAPKIDELGFGKELVANLSDQIYQLVNLSNKVLKDNEKLSKDFSKNFVAQNMPLPLLILDTSQNIKFANKSAVDYIGIPYVDLINKNVYMVLDMSFPSEDTFDNWLRSVQTSSATATKTWERVRMDIRDNHPTLMFDLAAFYNRDNEDHNEVILSLFDHTDQYSQDDQAINFMAISVHELRTPLTLLRGYIEVFEEELGDKVSVELQDFMNKMHAQAEQLMAFVNNILNVARVDDDQLVLKLEESNWSDVLKMAVSNLAIRAKVRDVSLNCSIAKNLPPVAVDKLSIQEVINNLVDNAIKYSGESKVINISTRLTSEGLVETTVQDFGLGISTAIIPNLFTKFYRDHHNRAQIGGTGLGLYLSKAIVQAHGGNLWVRSKEGKGSTFGFTLMPYEQVNKEAQNDDKQSITRSAHGWIKNHSLYRR